MRMPSHHRKHRLHTTADLGLVAKNANWAQLGVKSDIRYGFIADQRLWPQLFDAATAPTCTFSATGVRAVKTL
ncbi:MAG: hypothetical protein Q4A92_09440 [Corynebacterium sp.]|nr:hypothetical protein [Corynebacterium sp.]